MIKSNLLTRKILYQLHLLHFLACIVFGASVRDAWAEFKWVAVERSPGVTRPTASDGHGTVIAVGQSPGEVSGSETSQLFYAIGQYDLATTATIKWGPQLNYAIGAGPTAALAYCAVRSRPNKDVPALTCNTGIVAVHGGGGPTSGNTTMWYRVGVINGPSDPIAWKAPDTKFDDHGILPFVAISGDASTVVEVHNGGANTMNAWYRVGKVNWDTGIINWGTSTQYGTGFGPNVAVSGSTVVVVNGPAGTPAPGGLVYLVGHINSSSLTISGLASSPTVYDSNVNDSVPQVAISSCEFGTDSKGQPAVEVHDEGTNTSMYRVGTFDGKTLTLGSSQTYGPPGWAPGGIMMGSDGVPITSGPKATYVGTLLCPTLPPPK